MAIELGRKDIEGLNKINKYVKYGLVGGAILNILAPGIGVWYTLNPGEAGVVKRGGKYHHTSYNVQAGDSGLYFKIPELLMGFFPGDDVTKVNVIYPHRILIGLAEVKEEGGLWAGDVDLSKPVQYKKIPEDQMERMITKDVAGFVYPSYVIQYTVTDPAKYLFNFKDVDMLLTSVELAEMRANVALYEDDAVRNIKRAEIGAKVKTRLQQVADLYDLGIRIDVGTLQDVRPSEITMDVDFNGDGKLIPMSVQMAYDRVATSEKDRDALIKEGKIYEAGRLQKAEETKETLKIAGDTYYINTVGTANADTQRLDAYLTSFQKTKDTSEKRLIVDAMADIVMNAERVVIASGDGTNKLVFIPVEASGKDVSVNVNMDNQTK